MTKTPVDYEFECLNYTDYSMVLHLPIKGYLVNMAFQKARVKLAKDRGLKVKDNIGNIDEFKVEKIYYNLLTTGLKKNIKNAIKQVNKDGIEILNFNVDKAIYKRDGKEWRLYLYLIGTYADKR